MKTQGKIPIFASYDFLKVNKLFETSKVCQVLISSKFLNRVHLELLACNKHPYQPHQYFKLIPAKTIIYSFKKLLKEIIFLSIMNYFPQRSVLKDGKSKSVKFYIFIPWKVRWLLEESSVGPRNFLIRKLWSLEIFLFDLRFRIIEMSTVYPLLLRD